MDMDQEQIREQLRKGLTVEVKPEVFGRLNAETKRLDLSDGRSLALSSENQEELFPRDESHKREISEREKVRKRIANTPFGEELFQIGQKSGLKGLADFTERYISQPIQSIKKRPGQEDMSFSERMDENYKAQKNAKSLISQEIAERSPMKDLLTSGAALALDVYATRKLPGVQAAPALTLAHRGTDLMDSPEDVLKEAGVSSLLGYGLDKAHKGLSNVAASRANRRAMRQNIADIEKANISGRQNMDILNKQRAIANETEIAGVNAENAATQAAYETQLAQREAELASIPQRQQLINEQFGENVGRNLDQLERIVGKSNIPQETLGIEKFIIDEIETTALAGTKEANQAGKFLRSIFQGTEGKISAPQIRKGFNALENRIATSSGDFRDILINFKKFAEAELPQALPNAVVFGKYAPRMSENILRGVRSDLSSILNRNMAGFQKDLGVKFEQELSESLSNEINRVFQESAPQFSSDISSGTLRQNIVEAIRNDPKYIVLQEYLSEFGSPVESSKVKGLILNRQIPSGYAEAKASVEMLPDMIAERFSKQAERFLPDIRLGAYTKAESSEKALQGIQGVSEIIPEPIQINSPSYRQLPEKFKPQPFIETPVPSMPEPQGVTERLGEALENFKASDYFKMKGMLNNPITKAASLKYLLGPAAYPVQAAAIGGPLALKGLTSPSTGGNLSREAMRRAGIGLKDRMNPQQELTRKGMDAQSRQIEIQTAMQAIEQIKSYPSYHDGILDSPEDRRAASEDIENNPYLGIEDKAILQTKINRGKPLE